MAEKIYLTANSKIPLNKRKIRKKILNIIASRLIGISVYVKNPQVINKRIRLHHLLPACRIINKIASVMGLGKPFITDPNISSVPDKTKLLILDDVYPMDLYAWKPAEYDEILKEMPEASILRCNTAQSYSYGLTLDRCLSHNKKTTFMYDGTGIILNDNIKLVSFQMYCGFDSFNIAEMDRDFVMTFYPSGGFRLYDYECNNKMKGICASKHFKHLIVTQKIMYDYFVENGICPKEKITLIFGGCGFPVYSERKEKINTVKNICFCSNTYGDKGWKKGYDIFVSAAKKLVEKNKDLKFHVIGYGLNEKTIDISDIKKYFIFHGRLNLKQLKPLLEKMDMMIMPNRSQYFNDGGLDIDGFPVGTAAYGMMCGCPMFMTDPFDLNNGFYEDGKDFVKINFDSDEIVQKIQYHIDNPQGLNEIGQNGGNKTRELISFDRQIKPRVEIYRRLLEEYK